MKAYIAGPLFTRGERDFCRRVKTVVQSTGIEPLWPWELCDQRTANGNSTIFDSNMDALDKSDLVVAILDGPDVDSGTAWEIGYSYSKSIPVIGIRTDLRNAGENGHSKVNLMIYHVVKEFVRSEEELEAALNRLKDGIESQEKLDGFIKE